MRQGCRKHQILLQSPESSFGRLFLGGAAAAAGGFEPGPWGFGPAPRPAGLRPSFSPWTLWTHEQFSCASAAREG